MKFIPQRFRLWFYPTRERDPLALPPGKRVSVIHRELAVRRAAAHRPPHAAHAVAPIPLVRKRERTLPVLASSLDQQIAKSHTALPRPQTGCAGLQRMLRVFVLGEALAIDQHFEGPLGDAHGQGDPLIYRHVARHPADGLPVLTMPAQHQGAGCFERDLVAVELIAPFAGLVDLEDQPTVALTLL
jgi:hypothetical protein